MPDDPRPSADREALEQFGKDARLETRMLTTDAPATDKERQILIRDLTAYRERTLIDRRPVAWATLAKWIGVSPSVLTETVKGKYQGDTGGVLRKIDAFLAREASQAKRPDIRGFQRVKVTEHILVAFNQCVLRRSIGVITGEPGSGKTMHARWLRDNNDGSILITCDDTDADAKFVIDECHKHLRLATYAPGTRNKKREIEEYLQHHQNVIVIVDEAQKLTTDALEILRALHDKSDPEGRRNIPVLLFGDQHFYKKVMRVEKGKTRILSPQITSRMFPVISLESAAADRDESGRPIAGTVYTLDDITAIVRSQRLRIVRPEAMRFAVKLANFAGDGKLRRATRVLEIAMDLRREGPVTLADMHAALSFFVGASEASTIIQSIAADPESRMAAMG